MSRREVTLHLAGLPNGGDADSWGYGFDVAGARYRRWISFRFIDDKVAEEELFKCSPSGAPTGDAQPASPPCLSLPADLSPDWGADIAIPRPGGRPYEIPDANNRVFDTLMSASERYHWHTSANGH